MKNRERDEILNRWENRPLLGNKPEMTATLRDQFAMSARSEDLNIPGDTYDRAKFLGMEYRDYCTEDRTSAITAKARYIFADAMLEARKVQP